MLIPIVLLDETEESTDWRGTIDPPDWDRWFASYREFILYYARIAAETGAEYFSVGSELISTEFFRDRWVGVIDAVREVYPGLLLYSSNWDHYEQVRAWDRLDLVGVTAYNTVSNSDKPTVEELLGFWKPIKTKLLRWQRKIGKPIVFTEVGYPSQVGASRDPWNYYMSTQVDLETQKRCFEAFFATWEDEPAVAGVYVFEWWGEGGPEDTSYMPKGKPAMEVIRAWLER